MGSASATAIFEFPTVVAFFVRLDNGLFAIDIFIPNDLRHGTVAAGYSFVDARVL